MDKLEKTILDNKPLLDVYTPNSKTWNVISAKLQPTDTPTIRFIPWLKVAAMVLVVASAIAILINFSPSTGNNFNANACIAQADSYYTAIIDSQLQQLNYSHPSASSYFTNYKKTNYDSLVQQLRMSNDATFIKSQIQLFYEQKSVAIKKLQYELQRQKNINDSMKNVI